MKDISLSKIALNYLLYLLLLLGLMLIFVFPIKSQLKPETQESITGAEFIYQQF